MSIQEGPLIKHRNEELLDRAGSGQENNEPSRLILWAGSALAGHNRIANRILASLDGHCFDQARRSRQFLGQREAVTIRTE